MADVETLAQRARTLAQQRFVEAALDILGDLIEEAGVTDLVLDLDDRDRVTVDRSFDPPFIEGLRRIPGAFRDKAAGVWRVPPEGLTRLIDLVEGLAGPRCSPLGCALGDEPAPSQAHLEAHRAHCAGS